MSKATRSLEGKRVVVIGGASGIGFAIAELPTELGTPAVVGSRKEANVRSATERIDGAKGIQSTCAAKAALKLLQASRRVGSPGHYRRRLGRTYFVPTKDLDLVQARSLFDVRFWGAPGAAKHTCRT